MSRISLEEAKRKEESVDIDDDHCRPFPFLWATLRGWVWLFIDYYYYYNFTSLNYFLKCLLLLLLFYMRQLGLFRWEVCDLFSEDENENEGNNFLGPYFS